MAGALLRYRIMAWVTGVFLLSLTIWLILGYTVLGYADGSVKPAAYALMWTGHGWLYFIYLITAVDLTFRMRWSIIATIGVLIAGTIPLASFFAEHWVTKRVRSELADLPNPDAASAAPADQAKQPKSTS
jgi:integral membrane protein